MGMIILAATPGPGVITSMARAIAEGFKASLYFIGGLVAGDTVFLLLALFGLSAMAKLMGGFFLVVRIVGGLYLIYLGVKIYRDIHALTPVETKRGSNRIQIFTSGVLVTMGNPKPILFYASVLPTLIDFNEVRPVDVLVMILLIAVVSFSVLGTYSYIASLSHKVSMSDRWRKGINQVAGVVMIIVGLFVIVK
jgi:threonine/homoserine/homoserine lactone efflux protein